MSVIYVTDPFLIWTLQLVLTMEYVHTETLCGCFRLLYWKPPPRLSNSFSSRKFSERNWSSFDRGLIRFSCRKTNVASCQAWVVRTTRQPRRPVRITHPFIVKNCLSFTSHTSNCFINCQDCNCMSRT